MCRWQEWDYTVQPLLISVAGYHGMKIVSFLFFPYRFFLVFLNGQFDTNCRKASISLG
jgi:hypothetical protein